MREAESGAPGQLSLESVLEQTKQRFLSKEMVDPTLPSHPKHGQILEGYTVHYACSDTVEALAQSGVNLPELAGTLMQLASTPPADRGIEGDTWEEISKGIIIDIISAEMSGRFPELVEINDRRMDFDSEDSDYE